MLVVAVLAAHSYPGSCYEQWPQGWDARRARSAAMRGSCCVMGPLAARAELGDLRARSRLRTPGHG